MKVLVRRSMRIGLVFVDKREGSRITDSEILGVDMYGLLDYINVVLEDERLENRIIWSKYIVLQV